MSIHVLLLCLLAQEPPPARSIPAFVWCDAPSASAVVRAFGGACVGRVDEARELREAELDWFVFNAPGRNDLHLDADATDVRARRERWFASRDDVELVRQPCLTDPDTRARLERLLDESLDARGGALGRGVALGDEVGLTPGGAPEDLCLSPTCRARWSAWWRREFASDAPALESVATDATLAALAAGDTEAIGPWLARRRFHHEVVFEVLEHLAARVRARAPRAPVGLLGIAGRSAFGGVDVWRAARTFDFTECYAVGNARELGLTARHPGRSMWLTAFAERGGPAASARVLWDHWMRGGDGFVIWRESELERAPEQRTALLEALAAIRELDLRLAGWRPRPRGLAVVHSEPSLAVQWLRDAEGDGRTWPRRLPSWQERHGTLERARRRWFEAAEEFGGLPGAIPIEELSAATAERFRVLVLVHLLVVEPSDIERLRAFRAAGGRLLVDGEFAWIDARGRTHSPQVRRAWREMLGLERPPSEFWTRDEGSERRAALAPWWCALGLASPPWRIAGGDVARRAWTQIWIDEGEQTTGVLLPRVADRALELALQVDEGRRIEWLHPDATAERACTLPAGSAAVLRVTPRR